MSLRNTIRNVIVEHHNKKILKESINQLWVDKNLLNEENNLVKLSSTNYSNLKYDNDGTKNDSVNKPLLDDINSAAKSVGIVATITTAKTGHAVKTTSNNVSRHMNGTGVDVAILDGIGSGGATNAKNGIPTFRNLGFKLKNALVSMGYTWNTERGNDKAVLWHTNTGGNHYNHLHISNRSGVSSAPIKPVEKGKTKEYMVYTISSGQVFNPTGNYIGSLGTLISKRNGEPIYGSQRKRDGRIFLFAFDNNNDVLYIEMSNEDFLNYDVKKRRIEGTWEKLSSNSVIRDSKSKNSEKQSETKSADSKSKGTTTKDDRLSAEVQAAINKLKTVYGLTITKNHIDKEFEQEVNYRADAGKENKDARTEINKLITDCKNKFPKVKGGVVSGYRSYQDQVDNFGGKAVKRGIDNTQKSVALPGFSQHHTGKTFDIFSTEESWWNNNPDVKKWVADNAGNYGFEITYKTQGRLRVAEPWHLYYKR